MKKRRLMAALMGALLFMMAAFPVAPALSAPAVNIGASATVALTNVNLIPGDESQILSYDLKYTNNGTRPLELLDYWTKVVSKSGVSYPVRAHPEDRSDGSLAPNSSTTVRYYSRVGNNLKLEDLRIQVIQFDLSLENFERTIGSFDLSSQMSVTPANKSRLFELKGTPVYSKVKEYFASEGAEDEESTVQATFVLFNNGRRSITVPDYRFFLKTESNLLYPLDKIGGDEGNTVNPKSYKEYQLSGTVAAGVSIKGAQLLLVQEIDTTNGRIEVAAGTYELAEGIGEGGGTSEPGSESLAFQALDASYEAEAVSLRRSPWDTRDTLAVEVRVYNRSEDIAAVPDLEGQIRLDNGVWLNLVTILNENEPEIMPGEYASVFMVGKISSRATYQTATVRLKLKSAESQTRSLGQLKVKSVAPMVPLSVRQTWITETYGIQSAYRILRTGTYKGVYEDLYMVQVVVRNDNYQVRGMLPLAGFFQTADGKVFKAETYSFDGTLSSGKSIVVNFWAVVPKDLDTRGIQFIFGEGVNGGRLTTGNATPDGMIQIARFRLAETDPVQTASSGIRIAPYTLDIKKFHSNYMLSNPSQNELTVRIEYELTQDTQYLNDVGDRKVAIAISYNGGETTFEHTLPIVTDGGAAAGGALRPGKGEIVFTETYPKDFLLHFYNDLELLIYEEFQGYKKLIAKKPFTLYFHHDWGNE